MKHCKRIKKEMWWFTRAGPAPLLPAAPLSQSCAAQWAIPKLGAQRWQHGSSRCLSSYSLPGADTSIFIITVHGHPWEINVDSDLLSQASSAPRQSGSWVRALTAHSSCFINARHFTASTSTYSTSAPWSDRSSVRRLLLQAVRQRWTYFDSSSCFFTQWNTPKMNRGKDKNISSSFAVSFLKKDWKVLREESVHMENTWSIHALPLDDWRLSVEQKGEWNSARFQHPPS